jgi:hypothetical protein
MKKQSDAQNPSYEDVPVNPLKNAEYRMVLALAKVEAWEGILEVASKIATMANRQLVTLNARFDRLKQKADSIAAQEWRSALPPDDELE